MAIKAGCTTDVQVILVPRRGPEDDLGKAPIVCQVTSWTLETSEPVQSGVSPFGQMRFGQNEGWTATIECIGLELEDVELAGDVCVAVDGFAGVGKVQSCKHFAPQDGVVTITLHVAGDGPLVEFDQDEEYGWADVYAAVRARNPQPWELPKDWPMSIPFGSTGPPEPPPPYRLVTLPFDTEKSGRIPWRAIGRVAAVLGTLVGWAGLCWLYASMV